MKPTKKIFYYNDPSVEDLKKLDRKKNKVDKKGFLIESIETLIDSTSDFDGKQLKVTYIKQY